MFVQCFKKSDKNKCENYRPISLLSNLSKLFERAMHTRVYQYLEKFKLLYNFQFGFRKKLFIELKKAVDTVMKF